MNNLRELLEPLATWFCSLGIPKTIVRWGHPLMMAIVVFVMGSFVGLAGWRGRNVKNKDIASKSLIAHRTLAPWMFLFIAAGYTGGVLSLVMQNQPILESPHFWTGSIDFLQKGLLQEVGQRERGKGKRKISTLSPFPFNLFPTSARSLIVLLVLLINGVIALTGFGSNQATLRTVHAHLGSTALCLLFLHAVLGLKLGLAI